MLEKIRGKKTYITGALGILTAVGTYLTGEIDLGSMLQAVLTAALGMTIRHGITTASK